jgi:hypothetical protein
MSSTLFILCFSTRPMPSAEPVRRTQRAKTGRSVPRFVFLI